MTILITLLLLFFAYHYLVIVPYLDAIKKEITNRENQNLFSNYEQIETLKKSVESDLIKISKYLEEHNKTGKEIINTIQKHFNNNQR